MLCSHSAGWMPYDVNELLSLQAERTSLAMEIGNQREALDDVTISYQLLQRAYVDGVLYAPVSGYIGSKVDVAGSVLGSENRTTADIYPGPSFVLAYLDDSYIFDPDVGEHIRVRAPSRTITGERLPITDTLPLEFQLPTKARNRGQLIKVSIRPSFAPEQRPSTSLESTRPEALAPDISLAAWRPRLRSRRTFIPH
jgi:hypothetical protein